jgi:hypothetical protein
MPHDSSPTMDSNGSCCYVMLFYVLTSSEDIAVEPRFFQDGLTGSAWGDWANYTDSPLRNLAHPVSVNLTVSLHIVCQSRCEVE